MTHGSMKSAIAVVSMLCVLAVAVCVTCLCLATAARPPGSEVAGAADRSDAPVTAILASEQRPAPVNLAEAAANLTRVEVKPIRILVRLQGDVPAVGARIIAARENNAWTNVVESADGSVVLPVSVGAGSAMVVQSSGCASWVGVVPGDDTTIVLAPATSMYVSFAADVCHGSDLRIAVSVTDAGWEPSILGAQAVRASARREGAFRVKWREPLELWTSGENDSVEIVVPTPYRIVADRRRATPSPTERRSTSRGRQRWAERSWKEV